MENIENNLINNNLNSNEFFNLSKEYWFNILSYLDLKSFLNLEKTSKFFRKIFLIYYSEKNTINLEKEQLKNKKFLNDNYINTNNINFPNLFSTEIKIYKKNIIEKYYNFLIQIPYNLAEFCGIYSNKSLTDLIKNEIIKINDIKLDINESLNCNSSLHYCNNYYTYKKYEFINNNKFMIFYNNTLNVFEININNIFERKYSQYFFEHKILYFGIIQNNIFLIDAVGKLIMMDVNNYATNLKKIRFYIPEEIIQIYYIGQYFIFLTKEQNFYYINFDEIFMKPKCDEELGDYEKHLLLIEFPNEERSIHKLFPKMIEKNYNGILDINANNNNFILFIDNNYEMFGLNLNDMNNKHKDEKNNKKNKSKNSSKNNSKNSSKNNSRKESYINFDNDIEKEKEVLSFYKINQGIKFLNYYTMAIGENYWILIEQNYRMPLIDWSTEEVSEWFEKELGYEEDLKVIKYQKVTGKNILEGDRKYFQDILGMKVNKIKQLCNKEIKKVEQGNVKNMKIWGYGNNRLGQLGLITTKYSKIPIKLEIPENELKNNNDFIIKIICSNTVSLLITKKGKIYICGNFNIKEKQNILNKEDKNENENEYENDKKGKKGKGKRKKSDKGKDKKEKKKEKEKEENDKNNLWVEISYEIKRIFTNNFYVKLKDTCIRNNIIYIFGLKINKKDFI